MLKPIEFLLENKDLVLSVFNSTNSKPKQTWDTLINGKEGKAILPKLSQIMKYNTFKQYLSVLVALDNVSQKETNSEVSKLRQIVDDQQKEIVTLKNQNTEMEHELSKLRQKAKFNNIDGWTLRFTSKGYYNLCKSFDGKVESIYIGKNLDQEKAKEKIYEKMSKLRQKKTEDYLSLGKSKSLIYSGTGKTARGAPG